MATENKYSKIHMDGGYNISPLEELVRGRGIVIPNYDVESEKRILSGILNDDDVLDIGYNRSLSLAVKEGITSQSFNCPENRRVWDIINRFNADDPSFCHQLYIIEHLTREEVEKGFANYIFQLVTCDMGGRLTSAHMHRFCRDLNIFNKNLSNFQAIMEYLGEMSERMYVTADETAQLISKLSDSMDNGREMKRVYEPTEYVDLLREDFEAQLEGKLDESLRFNFSELDKFFPNGIKTGSIVTVGAAPSIGKSALLIDLMRRACISDPEDKNPPCGILFTTEMTPKQICGRVWKPEINAEKARFPLHDQVMASHYRQAFKEKINADRMHLKVIDATNKSIEWMRVQALQYSRMCNLKWIALDYAQNVHLDSKTAHTRAEAIGEMMETVRLMAKEMGVVFLLASQLNRNSREAGKYPDNANLKDASKFEEDAHVILLMDNLRNDEGEPLFFDKSLRLVWASVTKNRQTGATGALYMGIQNGCRVVSIEPNLYLSMQREAPTMRQQFNNGNGEDGVMAKSYDIK